MKKLIQEQDVEFKKSAKNPLNISNGDKKNITTQKIISKTGFQ